MELEEAPDPIEVSIFHFSQLRTLRLTKGNEKVANECVNVLATSSKYGLVFIGIENGFKVLKLENILDLDEDKENKSIEENYYSKVVSSDTPILISLSSDESTLAVCVNKNSSVIADMYDIAAFADPEETPVAFQNVLLSSNGSKIKEFIWNPVSVNTYAFCTSDGSLAVHELSGTTLKVMANITNAAATAMSWSPKGKQIVVGKSDGSFSQYKPTLQEVKKIPPPTLEEKVAVANICWVSTTQFVVLYSPEEKGSPPYLMVVSTPKGAAITYTNFYDICLGNDSNGDQRYFLHFEPTWGITVCASTESIEVAVIGDAPNWVEWDVKEDGKALLPGKDGASNAIGMGVIYCAQRKIVISEIENYPPMPIIFILTNNGLLVSFHMINTATGLESLVRPSTPINRQGERKKPGHVQKMIAPNISQQNTVSMPSSTVIKASSVTQISAQANKTNLFSPAASTAFTSVGFGFSQNMNQTSTGQTISNVSSSQASISSAPMGMTQSSFSMPKTVSSSLQEKEKTQTVPNTANFSPSTASFGNEPKTTIPPSQITENVVRKEEINKQNTYIAAIIEEVQTFEKELQELKNASGNFIPIGTKEEKANLTASTLNFQDFQTEMAETMSSLNADIHNLKNALLEGFVMVEEANSRERKKNDHFYLSLLRERALDPITAKRMKKIEQTYLYLSTQVLEVNNKIDQDWYEYLEKRKQNQKSISHLSSAEAIYRTLVNNQYVIHNYRNHLNYVSKKADEKRLENMSKKKIRTQFMKNSTPEELSKLADTFLQTKITSEEEKSPKPKKISSEAQNVLKNYFSSAKVNIVRPTVVQSPSQSRLISKSILFTETKKSSSLQSSETQYDPPKSVIADSEKYKDVKLGTVSKFTLPSMQSPSPKKSSPSVSSSGGPLYEDITPPNSPHSSKYQPEALARFQELTSCGSIDEEKLNILLEVVEKYNMISQLKNKDAEKPESKNLQHENSCQMSNRDLSFEYGTNSLDVTKKNSLNKPFSFTSSMQNVINTEYGSSLQIDPSKENDCISSKIDVDNSHSISTFPKSLSGVIPSTGSMTNIFTSMQKSVSNTVSSVTGLEKTSFTQNSQDNSFMTAGSKSNSLFNPNVSSISLFPAVNKTSSSLDFSDKSTINEPKKTELVSSPVEVEKSNVASFSVLDSKTISQPPTLVFSIQSNVQSPSNNSETVSTLFSNKEQITVPPLSSVTPSENKIVTTSSFLFGTTPSESKITSNSSLFGKSLTDSKTGVVSNPLVSSNFSKVIPSKSDVSGTSSSVSPFSLVTPLISNTASSTSLSFLGTVANPESQVKTSSSFLFDSKIVQPEKQSESSAPDFKKNIAPVSSQIITPTSLTLPVTSSDLSVSATSSVAVEGLNTSISSPSTTPSTTVVSVSSIPTPDSISTTLSSTSTSLPTSSQQVTNTQSFPAALTTSLPSTTAPALFGQDSKSVFSEIFSAANNSQPSFFGTTSSVTATTTKQTSFFGNTSLDSTPTTQSFFSKTSAETPVFGQNSVFGSLVTNAPVSTQSTGSFFSQPATGSSSVFGSSTSVVNTSESSGFGPTSEGSFSFAKSPFGQTQGSFGLAKSVFGQSSTFGQPSAPQSNTAFGQSTGITGFGQGSFFSGLGGKPSEENASKNVFAIGNIGKSSTESSVFGSSGTSTFGAKTASFTPGGFSSGGGGSVAQSGFGSFQQTPQKPGGFGTAPTFGGSPSFGSAPGFGSPPTFGSGNALSSVFGSPQQQTSNFSNFASADSPTFGSLASQSPSFGNPPQQAGFVQQQGFGSAPVFGGGSAFGNQAPSFGSPSGGQTGSSAFTQWRN